MYEASSSQGPFASGQGLELQSKCKYNVGITEIKVNHKFLSFKLDEPVFQGPDSSQHCQLELQLIIAIDLGLMSCMQNARTVRVQ